MNDLDLCLEGTTTFLIMHTKYNMNLKQWSRLCNLSSIHNKFHMVNANIYAMALCWHLSRYIRSSIYGILYTKLHHIWQHIIWHMRSTYIVIMAKYIWKLPIYVSNMSSYIKVLYAIYGIYVDIYHATYVVQIISLYALHHIWQHIWHMRSTYIVIRQDIWQLQIYVSNMPAYITSYMPHMAYMLTFTIYV